MFDFNLLVELARTNPLFEFSRANCAAICTFLVPANILCTLQTMVLAGRCRPHGQVRQAALLACIPAVVMVLHVGTWLMVGVVALPTFVLLGLGSLCLGTNAWAMARPESLAGFVREILLRLGRWVRERGMGHSPAANKLEV
jgi:prepilin signal peptidase PulO-like enzyme (type II secretory pathway)